MTSSALKRLDAPAAAPVTILRPASCDLRQFSQARRAPPRPAHLRVDGYDEKFDAETLFFDVFRAADRRIVLMGPPFLNLKDDLQRMRVTALPSGEACRFTLRELDRHGQIHVEAPDETRGLRLETAFGTCEVEVQPAEFDRFAGRRVLMTLSRNNDLAWIQDWIRFNRDVHGADAVLFYDNGSDRYSLEALAESIGAVGGMAEAVVVSWPFKYGPQSFHPSRYWDSNFTQLGMLEHARRRFLEAAASVQNSDVDELVLTEDGTSIFAAAEKSRFGFVRYRGDWVVGTADQPRRADGTVRHTDFTTLLKPPARRRFGVLPMTGGICPCKWTLVPSRCPDRAQWGIHAISRWVVGRRTDRAMAYRHFREISDNWKYKRTGADAFDPALHERDARLAERYGAVDWTA